MKKITIILLLLTSIPIFAKTKFVFAYESRELFPIFLGNGTQVPSENPGVAVEIILLMAEQAGLEVSFQRLPWKRCLYNLEEGSADAVDASFKTERLKLGSYPMKGGKLDETRRISDTSYYLYKRKGSKLRWDARKKSFLNLTGPLGAPLGYSIADDLRKLGVKVDEGGNNDSNFSKVLAGRLAGVALHENVADFTLQQNRVKYKDIVKVRPAIKYKPYFLLLSRQFVSKHPKLSERIWDTLAAVRKKHLSRLFNKYYGLRK